MNAQRQRGRPRGRNLSDADIETIVELLDGWTGALTWPLLIDDIEKRRYRRYTRQARQALHKHERIRHAFQMRKEASRGEPTPKRRAATLEMQALLEENARQKAEIERLKAENHRLLDRFAIWAYNARIRGMDKTALNQPPPPASP